MSNTISESQLEEDNIIVNEENAIKDGKRR